MTDRAKQRQALTTVRELIDAGLAGNDCYQTEIFVVDTDDQRIRDLADIALDNLGAEFHRAGAYTAERHVIQCRLPGWVRTELDLDEKGAPVIVTPLASRAVDRDLEASAQMAAHVNRAYDLIYGPVSPVVFDMLTRKAVH